MKTRDFLEQSWVKEEIIRRLDYNPDTGKLTWADRDCPYFDKSKVGLDVGYVSNTRNYDENTLLLEVGGRRIKIVVARLCWLVYTGNWPSYTVDHIDRNSLNNKWQNLRDIKQSDNNKNKSPYRCKIFKGAYRAGSGWRVLVVSGGKSHWVGSYKCLGKALKAYDAKAKELHGEYARLNLPKT